MTGGSPRSIFDPLIFNTGLIWLGPMSEAIPVILAVDLQQRHVIRTDGIYIFLAFGIIENPLPESNRDES